MSKRIRVVDPKERQCPLCLSIGTLSASHRRNSHETFLAVVAPYLKPFRCSACNWRGMAGRLRFTRHNKVNTWTNAILYFVLLAIIVYGLVELRMQMHPVSLLIEDFVLPASIDAALSEVYCVAS